MRRTTITIAVLAGIFALGAIGGSWYALSSIDSMRGELENTRLELKKEDERGQTILDVKRQLSRLSAERSALGEYFFKEEDIVRLLEQLEDLARHADVDVNVNVAAAADRDARKIFRTGMKVEGSWRDVMYYVSLLESLPFRVELTRVNLSGGEGGEKWSGDVSLDLLSFVPKAAS
jgi:hypothetical protein